VTADKAEAGTIEHEGYSSSTFVTYKPHTQTLHHDISLQEQDN